MVGKKRKFGSRLDTIATRRSIRRLRVARDTHFRAIYTIFYTTKSGVDHLVFPRAHIRGEYTSDYKSFLFDHKDVVNGLHPVPKTPS